MTIRILYPGFLTSVQDLGRYGFQRYGVVASGSMDSFAHRVANLIVGNNENMPTLEMTIKGAVIEFDVDALFSICGGDLGPEINGNPVPSWRPIFAKKGTILQFKGYKEGCRTYLGIAGGFEIPKVMGSYSTYLRAGIGGYMGRALKEGDVLQRFVPSELSKKIASSIAKNKWGVSSNLLSFYQTNHLVRFVRGNEYHLFTKESQTKFENEHFVISPNSDRMGYRLEGTKLNLIRPFEMISEAVTFGTIQVPSDGNPIILLADRQTTGGYPKIAQIANVDLPILAQSKPGDKIRFMPITLYEAQQLFLQREQEIWNLNKQIERMYM
ncbi:MAG: biotin-dependent carboxyltransferase family protein [Bacillota bacterium]|nr:biotin-dependent carboxyltransferase family protein [Bacillota bacterium]